MSLGIVPTSDEKDEDSNRNGKLLYHFMNYDVTHTKQARALLVAGITAFAVASTISVASAQTTTDEIYISHYQGNTNNSTLRYDYSQTGATAPTFTENEGTPGNTTPYLSGSGAAISEGTAASINQIFGVGGANNNVVYVYDKATKLFRGSITGFGGVGNIAISNNGKYLYVADEVNSSLDAIDLSAIGSSKSTVSITDPGVLAGSDNTQKWHDLLVDSTGNVFAAGYTAVNKNIFKFTTPTLTTKSQFNTTTTFTDGITGMAINNGSLYAVNNHGSQNATNGSILKYNALTGVQDGTFSVTSPSLNFGFGIQNGPDGNLYVASLNGYTTNSAVTDTSNISRVTVSGGKSYGQAVGTVTPVIQNTGATKPLGSANGLVDPKYFVFGTANEVNVITTFGTTVPEPGTLGLIGFAALSLVAVRRRRTSK